jgi:hypothetical protein
VHTLISVTYNSCTFDYLRWDTLTCLKTRPFLRRGFNEERHDLVLVLGASDLGVKGRAVSQVVLPCIPVQAQAVPRSDGRRTP